MCESSHFLLIKQQKWHKNDKKRFKNKKNHKKMYIELKKYSSLQRQSMTILLLQLIFNL